MNLHIAVPFDGTLAYYEVFPEGDGIYQARLLRFDGSARTEPPQTITLTRSVRRWVGSFDRGSLVERLGQQIDEQLSQPRSRSSSEPAGG